MGLSKLARLKDRQLHAIAKLCCEEWPLVSANAELKAFVQTKCRDQGVVDTFTTIERDLAITVTLPEIEQSDLTSRFAEIQRRVDRHMNGSSKIKILGATYNFIPTQPVNLPLANVLIKTLPSDHDLSEIYKLVRCNGLEMNITHGLSGSFVSTLLTKCASLRFMMGITEGMAVPSYLISILHILNSYTTSRDVLSCQEDLIAAGLENYLNT